MAVALCRTLAEEAPWPAFLVSGVVMVVARYSEHVENVNW
jgi:hypothetical protein